MRRSAQFVGLIRTFLISALVSRPALHSALAQGFAASGNTSAAQNGSAYEHPLPNAPSFRPDREPGDLPFVNGRPYVQPGAGLQFLDAGEALATWGLGTAAIRAGYQQVRSSPQEWGEDVPGYFQRYGSAMGESAVNGAVRYTMAAVFHEDARYLICHHCTAARKIKNALLAEITTRRGRDGHRIPSPTPLVAAASGPLVSHTIWYPPGYSKGAAVLHEATLGLATRVAVRLAREFFLDHDTRQEKAAGRPLPQR